MKAVKFTTGKLITYILCLICAIDLAFPIESHGIQHFVIQVAASKTPIDIQQFSKRYKITDSIIELKTADRYRYVIGNFETLRAADQFARQFAIRTGISGIFPRKLDKNLEIAVSEQKKYPDKQSQKPLVIARTIDSIPLKIENTKINNQNINNGKKELKNQRNKNTNFIFRFLGTNNVYEFKNDLIVYGNKHFPLYFRKFYIRIIEKTYSYPIIALFILLIFFFIFNVILILLILYFTNYYKNKRDRYIRIYRNLYEEVLRSYLFDEIDWKKTTLKLKKIRRPLNRKILTSVLFNFQDNLRGEMDNRIPEIFVKLELNKDARNKAKSSFYYNQIEGMRELTNLYPQGAFAVVKHFINAPNDLVRADAQTSYIRLHPDKPFDFFKTLTSPFTRWTQITAFYLFRLHELQVPSFVDYLHSEQTNVRNFCLRMIIYFQQLENATEIFKLLKSPVETTRFLCIKAINELWLFDGKELIKNIYPEETEKNKLEIIKALKNIGNADDFDFLESIIFSGFVTLKIEACRSLYFMNDESRERLIQLRQNAELEIDKYIDHITDSRN